MNTLLEELLMELVEWRQCGSLIYREDKWIYRTLTRKDYEQAVAELHRLERESASGKLP